MRRRLERLAWVAFLALCPTATAADDGAPPAAPRPAPSPATSALPTPTPTPVAGGRMFGDLVYASGRGGDRTLDLYLPERTAGGPAAVVVWVHGGGWVGGDKRPCPTVGLLAHGFATASVGYRLATEAPFPAQLEDVKAAVRWLRTHAKEHGLDPERIGAAGASAGGHLVALLGTAGDAKDLEGDGGNPEASSRVQAVCDVCGPTDLLQFDGHGSVIVAAAPDSVVAQLLGGPLAERRDLARRANPIAYATADDPPFLIVHGDRDDVVPIEQSRLLDAALDAVKVPSTLLVVRGAGHDALRPAVVPEVVAFFQQHLRRRPAAQAAAPEAPPPTTPTPKPAPTGAGKDAAPR